MEDGAIVCRGARSHLYYVGSVAGARFVDFEFETEVLARPGANSGVYFHTAFEPEGWPSRGYEVQVNNTATGEGGYRERKKTGSLYGIRNVHKQLVGDDVWFRLRVMVQGKRVRIWVNEVQTVDYTEPANPANGGYAGRRVASGTFALQSHDPGSEVRFRGIRVRVMAAVEAVPSVEAGPSAALAALHANNYPVVDWHTHLKGGLTMAEVVGRQYRTGINAGVAVNCGLGFAITNDAGIDRALAELRAEPLVFAAMQAEGREWLGMFSPEAVARFDYVFTDAMTVVDDRGKRMRLWIPEEVEVGEPEAFMEMLVERTVRILEREPVDLWVNPTFLPGSIAGDYAKLWTPARMQRVIEAAVRRGVAIEINDRFRLPSADFVRRAKQAGAKFSFGTNNGGKDDLGQLDYCVAIVRECGLEWQDMWVPGETPGRARVGAR